MGYHKFHHTKIRSQSKRTKYKTKSDFLRANFKFTSRSLTLKQSSGRDPIELLNRNSHIQILVIANNVLKFSDKVSKVHLKPNLRGHAIVFKHLLFSSPVIKYLTANNLFGHSCLPV